MNRAGYSLFQYQYILMVYLHILVHCLIHRRVFNIVVEYQLGKAVFELLTHSHVNFIMIIKRILNISSAIRQISPLPERTLFMRTVFMKWESMLQYVFLNTFLSRHL
jgi:hypothetical protein